MSRPIQDLKVAIVGGGICGLLCATNLAKGGIRVEVFEQAAKFGEVGAGVALGANALAALEKLGVLQEVIAHANEKTPTMRAFRFVSGLGTHHEIYNYPLGPNDYWLGIYRPAFLDALTPMLDPSLVHFNHRCESVSISPSGSPVLHFANGKTFEADLVIGADGIKSVVRSFVYDGPVRPVYSNSIAYRAVVPIEALKDVKTNITDRPVNWLGPDKHIITFPIQAKKFLNVVVFCTNSKVPVGSVEMTSSWVAPSTQEEVFEDFSGWGPDVMTILGEIKKPSKWHVHFISPTLSAYSRQRVVLIGDAAHAMLPHLGAGAGQGIEDVLVLCALLRDPRTREHDLDAILRAYDEIRMPQANVVHSLSMEAGDIYEGRGKRGGSWDQRREQLVGLWDPVWYHDLDKDVERAVMRVHGRNTYF